MAVTMQISLENVQENLKEAMSIIRAYDWLIDSYVLVCLSQ